MDEYKHLKELKQAAPYLGVYTIFCSCAYLVFYWSNFNINPFYYIGAGDILSQSGMLLFQSAIVVVGISVINVLIPFRRLDDNEIKYELSGLRAQAIIIAIVASALLFFANEHPQLYLFISGPVLLLVRPVSYTNLIRHSFTSHTVRTSITTFLISFPVFSYVTAMTEAIDIKNKSGSLVMLRNQSGTCATECILIGKIGEYFAVQGNNNKIIMIKSDEIKVYEILKSTFDR